VEGGRIEAGRDADASVIGEDQFQGGSGTAVLRRGGCGDRFGTDADREESRSGRRSGDRSRGGEGRGRATAGGPVAEGVDGDLAAPTELILGQTGATKVGQDGGPVEFARLAGHGGSPRKEDTTPS